MIILIFSFSFILFVDVVYAQTDLNETNVNLSDKTIKEELGEETSTKKDETQDNPAVENQNLAIWGLIVSIIVVIITVLANIHIHNKRSQQDLAKEKRNKAWELFNKFYSESYLPIRSMVWDEVRPMVLCTVPKEGKDDNPESNKKKPEETERQLTPYGKKIVSAYLTEKGGSELEIHPCCEDKHEEIQKKDGSSTQNDSKQSEIISLENILKQISSGLKTTGSKNEKFIKHMHSLNLLLYFWVELQLSLKNNQCDETVAFTVFKNMFWWWKKFLIPWKKLYMVELVEVNKDYENEKDKFPEPPWLESIEKLTKFFENGKYPRDPRRNRCAPGPDRATPPSGSPAAQPLRGDPDARLSAAAVYRHVTVRHPACT